MWNLERGCEVTTLLGHNGRVNAVSVHRTVVASASDDGTVILWKPFQGELEVRGAMTPTRKAREKGRSQEKDDWIGAGAFCQHAVKAHGQAVRSLAIAGASTAVTGSADGSVKLWPLAPVASASAGAKHTSAISAIALAPSSHATGTLSASSGGTSGGTSGDALLSGTLAGRPAICTPFRYATHPPARP